MADHVIGIVRSAGGGLGFRAWVLWTAAALMTAIAPSAVAAQEGPHSVRISLTADRAALTVGDIVNLTLEVTHPADHVVVVPRLEPEWGPFEVISQTPARTESNLDGTETTRQHIEVTLFAPGTFETPRLSMSVRSLEGRVEQVFPSPVRLTVDSVLPGSDEELQDIRPPADFSPGPPPLSGALAAALAVVAALAAGSYFFRLRRRGREERPAAAKDLRTPWEVAVQEIDRVERLYLPAEGRFKEHYALIAGAAKAYLHATYLEDSGRAVATEMTTGETIAALGRSRLDRKDAHLAAQLLLEADLVRFSSYTPPASQAHDALLVARGIVQRTKTVEEASHQRDAHAQGEVTA